MMMLLILMTFTINADNDNIQDNDADDDNIQDFDAADDTSYTLPFVTFFQRHPVCTLYVSDLSVPNGFRDSKSTAEAKPVIYMLQI